MPLATPRPFARLPRAAGVLLLFALAWAFPVSAEESAAFPRAYLDNPDNIRLGQKVWEERCVFCHGRNTYPGKAPRLEPKRYLPDFVYARVSFGFRGMPAWNEAYSEEQRRAVVAWVMSPEFTP